MDLDPIAPNAREGVRLQKRLLDHVSNVQREFRLLQAGDRVLCGLSGGKDSYAMIWLLRELVRHLPFEVELVAVNLDQGHPGFPQHVIRDWCVEQGFEHHMLVRDTYSVVLDKIPEGKTYCSLCSRLRRGILYDAAVDLKCTKIALGHHKDDVIETLLMNLIFTGRLQAMPPTLRSDDGRNVVIRPLVACDETELAAFATALEFPIVPCDLCGSQENLQRKAVKRQIAEWTERNPNVRGSLFRAVRNVRASHLLDRSLWDRLGLDPTGDDESVP